MNRGWLMLLLIPALAGCGSSSKTLSQPDRTTPTTSRTHLSQKQLATAICSLPTTAQLKGILSHSVTNRRSGTEIPAAKGQDGKSAYCVLSSPGDSLNLGRFSYRQVSSVAGLLKAVRQGKLGSCKQVVSQSARETSFDCVDTAATAPDFSGRPEVAAQAFTRMTAVYARWSGPKGAPVPADARLKLPFLRALATIASERYGSN